jgi:N6-adenosine-specific RNA methylase IME4
MLTGKKYYIVYADPPWQYSSREYTSEGFVSLTEKYDVQSKEWIKALPVSEITAEDCALFLWTTDSHMKEAIETIESWGFKYITVAFVWNKKTKHGKDATTVGAWTIKNSEICLLGTKGKMLQYKKDNTVRQKVEALRTKHSRKPDEVRDRIVQLFGDLPRIELFARERFDGWDAWGNQLPEEVDMPSKV